MSTIDKVFVVEHNLIDWIPAVTGDGRIEAFEFRNLAVERIEKLRREYGREHKFRVRQYVRKS